MSVEGIARAFITEQEGANVLDRSIRERPLRSNGGDGT
jgi:hypothetical protein